MTAENSTVAGVSKSGLALPDVSKLPSVEAIRAELNRRKEQGFVRYFPDSGPLARYNYPKHEAFFMAGSFARERAIIGANRSGKTISSLYEVTLHATGKYPPWWRGKKFYRGTKCWCCGDTSRTVRDIIQYKLIGPPGARGTGMIPKIDILNTNSRGGMSDSIESIKVRHISGDVSVIDLKSYEQGREAFQGTEQDLIHLDEEPPLSIYTECLLRTMTTGGIIILSFTPLRGWTEVVDSFLKDDETNTKWHITIPWDDAPHLTADQKQELLQSIPLHQRDSRTKGIPSIGAGQIFPYSEDQIVIDDFELPAHFPRCYGMDVGWNWTAGVWLAKDRETDTLYLYSNYKVGETQPAIHAQAIKARGDWIKGAIDYAGTNQDDGTRIMTMYQDLGLNVVPANKAVEAGLFAVESRLSAGKLKIFRSCKQWFAEQAVYRRDEKGHIVKSNDHLMDATRYAVMKHEEILSTYKKKQENHFKDHFSHINSWQNDNWMG